MNTKQSYKLRIKVFAGFSIFLLLVIMNSIFQIRTFTINEKNAGFFIELNKIEELGKVFPRRSETYVKNAARDFESYNRDVKIFYKDIVSDIQLFDALLKDFTNKSNKVSFSVPKFIQNWFGLNSEYDQVVTSVEKANIQWQSFYEGFQEKIGNKIDEPRIEWGAKFIIKESPQVNQSIHEMVNSYMVFSDKQQSLSLLVLKINIAMLVLFSLLALVWFYFAIIRRVSKTAEACMQVANGDYGYALPVEGSDELSHLSKAFNVLSNRSQMVFTMLSELQHIPTAVHGLNVVVKASGSYLPVSWAGLVNIEKPSNNMNLTNALPPKSLANWMEKTIPADTIFAQQISDSLISKKSILINDLKDFVLNNPNELFLRELLKTTRGEALFVLPLTANSGWEGFALFVTRNGAYQKHQTELLENLAPLIASSFEKVS